MMCMSTNVLDAFLLRREAVLRCQWQMLLEYCLSTVSANQSGPLCVLLNKSVTKTDNVHPPTKNVRRKARVERCGTKLRDRVADGGVQERTT